MKDIATSDGTDAASSRYRYSIYLEDQDVLAFLVPELEGFFSDSESEDGRTEFILKDARAEGTLGAQLISSPRARRTLGNIDLNILNQHGDAIGSYYIATPTVQDIQLSDSGGRASYNIKFGGFTVDRHRKNEETLWEARRSGGPHEIGTWKKLSPVDLLGWLDVCRLANDSRRAADIQPESAIALDGREIGTESEFYCALGEAVNGPGGYFGSGLDSLQDCLRGGFGVKVPVTISWTASDVSRLHIGERRFSRIIEVLETPGVTLSLM